MESIEKLRKYADGFVTVQTHDDLMGLIDEVEAEISEKYMELPTDADGNPIHVGDGIRISVNKTVAAEFVRCDAVAFQHGDGLAWKLSENVRNVQNLTVEDMLENFGIECDEQYPIRPRKELIAEYADEIRELLGVVE